MEKIIVIVGMGGGISYGVALKFGRQGYKVIMISRNVEKLKAYQEMLANDGIEAAYVSADAGSQAQLTKAFAWVRETHGHPEVLFYNAAHFKDKNILRETPASIANDIKINVGGALHCVKQVIRPMKKWNKGTLLFTGGGLALQPHPNYGSLAIGKAALHSLVKQLIFELNYTHIKVGTVVVKGFVKADDLKYNPTAIADQFWQLHAQTGKGRNIIEY